MSNEFDYHSKANTKRPMLFSLMYSNGMVRTYLIADRPLPQAKRLALRRINDSDNNPHGHRISSVTFSRFRFGGTEYPLLEESYSQSIDTTYFVSRTNSGAKLVSMQSTVDNGKQLVAESQY
tara:strand:+ start:187 stop:552 length:366 start_codon:yes stop_codon:yes gene_type:complete